MLLIFARTLPVALIVMSCGFAHAADVTLGNGGRCDIQLRGIIAADDTAALTSALSQAGRSDRPWVLCLDSPGGSLSAAIAMAQLVHEEGIATHVEEGASCESACSITYFMGTALAGDTRIIARTIAPLGRIGLHAPSLTLPSENTYSGSQVAQAFALAMEAAGSITTLGRMIDVRSGDVWIPVDVVNHLLTTPAENMFYVTTFGQAQDWNIAVDGVNWPDPLSAAMLWNICNYGVRTRMGWSHVEALATYEQYRETATGDPVVLLRRHLVGQGEVSVSEIYIARSGYLVSGLSLACTVEVIYPLIDRAATAVSVCVTAVPEGLHRAAIRCDSPTDRLEVASALAAFDPTDRIDAIDYALARMAQSGLLARQSTD